MLTRTAHQPTILTPPRVRILTCCHTHTHTHTYSPSQVATSLQCDCVTQHEKTIPSPAEEPFRSRADDEFQNCSSPKCSHRGHLIGARKGHCTPTAVTTHPAQTRARS